jgi:hypothetical protein
MEQAPEGTSRDDQNATHFPCGGDVVALSTTTSRVPAFGDVTIGGE